MNIDETIIRNIHELPESMKVEVFDFIEYLKTKKIQKKGKEDWSSFSLSSAMRGMEDEQTSFSFHDLKETFS